MFCVWVYGPTQFACCRSRERAVAVEFAFRGGFKRLDGQGSFVAEQRAQAERWCCFGFAVASKW